MRTYLKLAWRNIWRNKTRTILTTIVVFILVVLATIMNSQQYGIYDRWINNIVEYYGHFQIQDTAFWENQSIDDLFPYDSSLMKEISNNENIQFVFPRLNSGALAAFGRLSRSAFIVGIEPFKEDKSSHFSEKLVKYKISPGRINCFKNKDIPDFLKKNISRLRGKSYISVDFLEKDIQSIAEDENHKKYMNIFRDCFSVQGQYLEKGDDGVVIGEGLAKLLHIDVNDTLVLMGRGYHGVSADGLFPVRGIIKLPDLQLSKKLILMDLQTCQQYYSAENNISTLIVKLNKAGETDNAARKAGAILPGNLKAKTWEEMLPDKKQMIESDKAGGYFMKGIFYGLIAFLIFSTIMMMITERKKELGIVVAIGMRKIRLFVVIFFETLFIGILGTLLGMAASFPIINYIHNNPIPMTGESAEVMEEFGFESVMYFSNSLDIFIWQPVIIFVITMVIMVFPLINITRLNIIKAIRG